MQNQIWRTTLQLLIDKIELNGTLTSRMYGWGEPECDYVALCITHKIVTIREVRELLRKRLMAIGRENYEWVIYEKPTYVRYPDHCPSPPALAFAIQQDEFTEEEIGRITFDHGDTWRTFVQEEGKLLLDTVQRQIVRLT